MTIIRKSDHKQASLTLYHVVALNAEIKLGHTINKIAAAQVLANLLKIDRRAPMSWLRGGFIKHPLSRENFLKFIRAYRTRPGLETTKKITALAISIYGSHYKRAIELLDPADRESHPGINAIVTLPGEAKIVTAIYNLLEASSEAIEIALGAMNTFQWTASALFEKLVISPNEIEIGTDKIISVIIPQFSENQREDFSKLGGLPELASYNLDCFETVWGKNGTELADALDFFEQLNLVWKIKEDEWNIKPHVLSIARQYLEELPEDIQLHARHWWRRFLDKPSHHDVFRSHLFSRHTTIALFADAERIKDKREITNFKLSFLKRLSRRVFVRIDTDWECMQSFSHYMSYEDFVFAQFILLRHKRDLLFGFLISLWLGTATLMYQSPLLMGCAVSAGVYTFFRLLIDLYRCDTAWAGLWEALIERAKSALGAG